MVRVLDADLATALRAFARIMDKPLVWAELPPRSITVESQGMVPRANVVELLRAVLAANDLGLHEDSVHYRVTTGGPDRDASGLAIDGEALRLHVIPISHARAADVAATINALFGRASAFREIGSADATGSTVDEPRAPAIAGLGDVLGGRAAVLTGDVAIVPDSRSNSLLVRASGADFALIADAVQQLDVRPLQVLIEVLIVEARHDRSYEWGLEFETPAPGADGALSDVSVRSEGLGLGDFALRVLKLTGTTLDATLHAAARSGDVSIVSRPVLLAANNETASIMVGSQRPFIQVSRSLPTDAPSRDQVVQYRDVGTELIVTPTLSSDGYVMLTVSQEVNAATTETAFDAPVISTRSVRTRLLVRDGQTAVLGGLSDQQEDDGRSGIPVLSSIPLLGGLFGRVSSRKSETELFIFITPRVIRSDEDTAAATAPFQGRVKWPNQ
jgi:general secretion pathway protein D